MEDESRNTLPEDNNVQEEEQKPARKKLRKEGCPPEPAL